MNDDLVKAARDLQKALTQLKWTIKGDGTVATGVKIARLYIYSALNNLPNENDR